MQNLLVPKETQPTLAQQLDSQSDENSNRFLVMALRLDRQERYEKMVEQIYGKSDAANRLLLKTLCLSAFDESTDNLAVSSSLEN